MAKKLQAMPSVRMLALGAGVIFDGAKKGGSLCSNLPSELYMFSYALIA